MQGTMGRVIGLVAAVFGLFALATAASAEVRFRNVDYQQDGVSFQGYLAWDDSVEGKRPGVLVVHEWWGLNDYVRERARQLAEMGYVAFAVDMYGSEKVTTHPAQAQEWMTQIVSNVAAWQARALKGLEVLRADEHVDASRIAAIGYCFGGATVMQLAYAGADINGVVSFHGSLPPAPDEALGRIKTHILVAHGSQDAFVPAERIAKFQSQLDKAGADWQMTIYSGTRHGFTNPGADAYGIDNLRYNASADRRSWAAMQRFFDEVL